LPANHSRPELEHSRPVAKNVPGASSGRLANELMAGKLSPDHGRPGVTSKKGVIRGFGGTERPLGTREEAPQSLSSLPLI